MQTAADADVLVARSFDVTRLEGEIPVGAGADTPAFSGCEGTVLMVEPSAAWDYAPPIDATRATLTMTIEGGVATQLTVCLTGLADGPQLLLGAPPFEAEVPLAGEAQLHFAVLASGGAEPGVALLAAVVIEIAPAAD